MKSTRFLSSLLFLVLSQLLSSPLFAAQNQVDGKGPACDSGTAAIVGAARAVTLEEVDKSIGKQVQALEERIYLLRKQALESIISRVVLESEARRENITVEALTRKLMTIEPRIPEKRVAEIYEENEGALAAIWEDEAKARIRLDLESQARVAALRNGIAELRSKTEIRTCLAAPLAAPLEISDEGPSLGPKDARVVIYEFSDFQCPYCRQARSTIESVMKSNQGKVRLVFKHLPLPIHPRAFPAAQAAYCAQEQGRFWAFHDRLFESTDLSDENLMRIAREIGLEAGRFASCIGSSSARDQVLKDVQESRRAGFSGTPTFVINGTVLRGAAGPAEFQKLIDLELLRERRAK